MATSLFWEYARMKPDYRYIVEPWSLRGYETTQGWVIFSLALAIVLLAVPLGLRLLKGKLGESLLVAGLVTAFATLVPIVAGAPARDPGEVVVWSLAVLLGLAAVAVTGHLLREGLLGSWRKPVLMAGFVAVVALSGLLYSTWLLGKTTTPVWLVVLLFMLTLSVMMLARPPRELASYRLLLIGVTLTWIVALVCAGAVRSTLLRLQLENMGIAAEYRDIQITSGILIAWVGGLLAFAGSVAMWARRRDDLQEHSRAGQQMAVAELSVAEMEEAV